MNSHVNYIKRQNTFSRDKRTCKNPKGCDQIYFALSDLERFNLLALNLTESDLAYIEKSEDCPPCIIERRFELRLSYDQYRQDNFSEGAHICGGCRASFKLKNIGNLIAELQPGMNPVEKINRVFALMHEDRGKGRCTECAVEQIEKESHQCEMCKTDLTKHRSLDSTTVTGLCFRELDIRLRDAERISKKVHNMMHKEIDALCFHCAAYKIEKDQ